MIVHEQRAGSTRGLAASPAMAALSVAYHGTNPAVPEAVAEGFRKLPPDLATQYQEHAINMSPLAVQRILEKLMASDTWPVYSKFAKEHFGRGKREGRAEGKAEAIIDILETRGLDVSETDRERIADCTDLRQLKRWLRRAIIAEKTADLFAENPGTRRKAQAPIVPALGASGDGHPVSPNQLLAVPYSRSLACSRSVRTPS
jgi:hypothetical protein